MADFTTAYREVEPETALSEQKDAPLVDGPASLLALSVSLGVPVLGRKQTGGRSGSGGFPFSAARPVTETTLRRGVDWVNKVPHGWFERVALRSSDDKVVKVKVYVVRRAVFAAMATELRILAHEPIRQSRNIVALVGMSWGTRKTSGRFLPDLLLESAGQSSLNQYIRTPHHRLGFADKAMMLLDVVSAVGFLHENGIVHCDVNTDNVLVCECPERQPLAALDVKPCIGKLCDFGRAVILSDYPESHQFSLDVGRRGWVAPEVTQGLALSSETLLKTDIYSLGHVAAAIAVGARLPLAVVPGHGDTPGPGEGGPAPNFKRVSTLLARESKNGDLGGAQLAMFSEVISWTLQSSPSDRADAADIYQMCHRHWSGEIRRLHSENPPDGGLSAVDYLKYYNGPPTMRPADDADILDRHDVTLLPDRLGKPLARMGAINKMPTRRVPDFAFETAIRSSQLSRQCRAEVYGDLERRAAAGSSEDAGGCALQLAALLLNGYLDGDGRMQQRVEAYLKRAIACGNEEAMSGAVNVFQAMGRELPEDSRLRILQRFGGAEFREQGIAEVKGLFFPLALDTSAGPQPPTGATRFPFAHRQASNEKLVGVRTWARECRQDFGDYLASAEHRRDLHRAVLRILEQHGAIPPRARRHPPFGSVMDRYAYDADFDWGLLDPDDRDDFINKVRAKGALAPTGVGLTLLQLAVCRDDLLVVSTLLEDCPDVGIDSCGNTPNWTPLWLACFLGLHEIAALLIRHGADLACRDSAQNLTILHLLSQFPHRGDVYDIGQRVLAAGVDVDDGFVAGAEQQDGVTPLLASMLAFDFSDGAAALFLLDSGASPLCFTTSRSEAHSLPVSPLALCVRDLDVALAESVLSSAGVPPSPGVRSALAVGVQLMRTRTCFRAMAETGRNYANLEAVLREVAGRAEARVFYWEPDWSPLRFACDIDRADMMELLLRVDPGAPPDPDDGGAAGDDLLEECAGRHNFRAVEALVRHGADVLRPARAGGGRGAARRAADGEGRLARIAKEMPAALGFLANHLESLPAEKRGGRAVRDLLEQYKVSTAGVFDTIKGSNARYLVIDKSGRQSRRKAAFRYLRQRAAQLWYELDGYFIGGRIVWMTSVCTRDLYTFLQRITRKYSLGPWVHRAAGDRRITWGDVEDSISSQGEGAGASIPDFVDDVPLLMLFSETSRLAVGYQYLRSLELIWSETCLRLLACDLAFPDADLEREAGQYFSARVEQRAAWTRVYGEEPPYATAACLEPWTAVRPDGGRRADHVEYTRPGRVWTQAEVGELAKSVFGEWSEELDEREAAVPAGLRAAAVSCI